MKTKNIKLASGLLLSAIALSLLSGCQTNSGVIDQTSSASTPSSYQYVYEEVSWDEAKARAELAGGQLACLETREEFEFVLSWRGSNKTFSTNSKPDVASNFPGGSSFRNSTFEDNRKTIWVGLSDADHEGKWYWLNGEKLNPNLIGWLERGIDLQYRDYAHIMRQGGMLSREASGQTPRGWQASRHVEGYLIEWK